MEIWSICQLHKICLTFFFLVMIYANKYQALQEKEYPFGSLDLHSCIGPTEALAVLAGGTLISKIGMSTSCGFVSRVCVGSSLMHCSKVH